MTEQTSDSESGEFDDVLDQLSEAVEDRDGSSERTEANESDIEEIVESDDEIGLYEARNVGRAIASDLIGSPLDGIIEVGERDEDGWRVVAEVVERNSIPDTQDVLGRYVIGLGPSGTVQGYGRAGRYRRGDTGTQTEIFEAEER
ncbi:MULTISPECIES: gas vesicle protein GvpO [unclassified Haladaptatus]|uniref:gas vesicle protein GvpO n=1 Tax=unclassified Haladaptatus TaxID=2622732 RepID=UPI00209BFD0B|nr:MULTISPECIES: gas vesicle protein GvpO [unclassified Haladaptatus]MCO8243940.1 gas vesicle protein [Haladaptatus sp. AB643]MCO8256475.1 gas vesicle protein [Haladaptatus sp. AB618]